MGTEVPQRKVDCEILRAGPAARRLVLRLVQHFSVVWQGDLPDLVAREQIRCRATTRAHPRVDVGERPSGVMP